jgi:SIR2-like domain/TIR domain
VSGRHDVREADAELASVRPLKTFINHRRAEAAGHAKALFLELAPRFGRENVFLDSESLQPGTRWLNELRSEGSSCGVLLALIGPSWEESLKARERSPEEDQVRSEIETALRRGSGVDVIPVLLDDAALPSGRRIPASLEPLLRRQTAQLRLGRWEADVEALVSALEQIRRGEPPPQRDPEPEREHAQKWRPPLPDVNVPPPDAAHYEELVRLMLDDGSVVPALGPGTNSSDRTGPWREADLPDAEELAALLAQKLGIHVESGDLAEISQYILVDKGPGDLYRTLRRMLTPRCPPSSVHCFLASLPATLERIGYPDRYQLIVTTNYDDALERAFYDAEEPYDLAVYLHDRGRFLHVPHDGQPQVVDSPNTYTDFPLDAYGEVERTVIVKIHGAADPRDPHAPHAWKDNYVITEDDYIGYLSHSRVNDIVPQQILGKLKESHFLFLGYTMRDWSLRVFVQRIFGRQSLNSSWAIQRDPNRLDARFWRKIGVDLFALPLVEYVHELGQYVEAAAPAPVE